MVTDDSQFLDGVDRIRLLLLIHQSRGANCCAPSGSQDASGPTSTYGCSLIARCEYNIAVFGGVLAGISPLAARSSTTGVHLWCPRCCRNVIFKRRGGRQRSPQKHSRRAARTSRSSRWDFQSAKEPPATQTSAVSDAYRFDSRRIVRDGLWELRKGRPPIRIAAGQQTQVTGPSCSLPATPCKDANGS